MTNGIRSKKLTLDQNDYPDYLIKMILGSVKTTLLRKDYLKNLNPKLKVLPAPADRDKTKLV